VLFLVHARRRRAPPSPAYAEVLAELRKPWRLERGDHELMAEQAHELAELADPFDPMSGLILAARHRYLVLPRTDDGCGVAGLVPGVLLVRPSADDRRFNLRCLHEVGEGLMDRHHKHGHTHADVWALTLALAIPRRAYRRRAEAHHVPQWAVRLRERLANTPRRAA
jgi:hypothetical protein